MTILVSEQEHRRHLFDVVGANFENQFWCRIAIHPIGGAVVRQIEDILIAHIAIRDVDLINIEVDTARRIETCKNPITNSGQRGPGFFAASNGFRHLARAKNQCCDRQLLRLLVFTVTDWF